MTFLALIDPWNSIMAASPDGGIIILFRILQLDMRVTERGKSVYFGNHLDQANHELLPSIIN